MSHVLVITKYPHFAETVAGIIPSESRTVVLGQEAADVVLEGGYSPSIVIFDTLSVEPPREGFTTAPNVFLAGINARRIWGAVGPPQRIRQITFASSDDPNAIIVPNTVFAEDKPLVAIVDGRRDHADDLTITDEDMRNAGIEVLATNVVSSGGQLIYVRTSQAVVNHLRGCGVHLYVQEGISRMTLHGHFIDASKPRISESGVLLAHPSYKESGGTIQEGEDYYILQFVCPPVDEWLAEVEKLGFVNSQTWIVAATAKTIKQLLALPYVYWIGEYAVDFRLPLFFSAASD